MKNNVGEVGGGEGLDKQQKPNLGICFPPWGIIVIKNTHMQHIQHTNII